MADEEIENEDELMMEFTNPSEEINACYSALAAVDSIDYGMATRKQKKIIDNIKEKSLEIINEHINFIHACLFDDQEPDE